VGVPGTRSPHSIQLAIALAALIGGGCAMVEKDRRAVGLQIATSGYESALRWGYYETAIGFLHPDQRLGQGFPEVFTDLRVTGYEVVQPPVIQADASATQTISIDYVFEDTQVVRQLTDRQVWRWDEQASTWWLHSGLPGFESGGKRPTHRGGNAR
jgi:hypothetical protein